MVKARLLHENYHSDSGDIWQGGQAISIHIVGLKNRRIHRQVSNYKFYLEEEVKTYKLRGSTWDSSEWALQHWGRAKVFL